MSHLDFKDIQVVNDSVNDIDIIRDIIKTEKLEDAFYVMDVGDIIKRHQEWISKMPKVVPHYAIKCNSNSTVIKVLAALNAFFDCASKQEIAQVMQYDVQGERIIFAHPYKLPSHIEYSRNVGVEQMTVDSEFELTKIKELFPEAKIVIRIRCDSKNSPILLGAKFGCDPCKEAAYLIQCVRDLGLNLYGFSFHVGTPCLETDAYLRGIEICKQLIAIAKSIGCNNVKLIDIGGGFLSISGKELDELAKLINGAIENLDPDIRVISEPGRYYVDSSFTLASYLHSKRLVISDNGKTRMYYMNCGVYNSFFDELLGLQARVPESVFEPKKDEKFLSNIWGPTADSYDLILKDVLLPEFHIGDWLVWKNMGAYTLTLSNTFNGFPIPTVRPFIRESQWKSFLAQIHQT
ncbi:PREDICTED: ornithine decarboxylase 1-like isoform X1 [Trachymyrmex septentrionalis]|uniref:ornithine decarboxylase 1-like isoform X1 n=1 Tax=Trachymyrmex septentrionalis TaxID=34720 RepID=UPI00084F5274|nr:PREDICTED: ornithine decarboxylase 1-like isoform X1 [Trachymyrmex septentrionalis]